MKIAADLMKIANLQLGVVFKQHIVEQWVEGIHTTRSAGFYVSIEGAEGFDLT
jgi:hypothetical protein